MGAPQNYTDHVGLYIVPRTTYSEQRNSYRNVIKLQNKCKLDAGMWRYHANRMDAHRSQFDLGRVDAYI